MADDATPSVERLLTESVWLSGLARALLHHDEHAAEDVAQEVRLAALREAPDDPDHARAWLVRVARNLALRTQLRRTRRERRERSAAVGEALPSTLDLVARVNAQKRVADAVVALDEPYRSVVLLRYFDALTARDIAAKQGVPIETVRTRIKRALAQLRERLDKDFGKRDAWAGLLLPWALPIEGAAMSTAAATASTVSAKAANAGAAAAVATGVATMSLTTKTAIAAAVVVAAALVWRVAAPVRAPTSDADAVTSNGLARPAEVASKVAGNGEKSHAAAERAADVIAPATSNDSPTVRDGFQVLATIVAASDGKPVDGALMTVFFNRRDGEKWIDAESVSAKSDAAGRVEAKLPATAQRGGRIEVVARGFAPRGHYGVDPARAIDRRLDLGTLVLEHGTLLKGRVVRARDGRPVANAEMRITLPEIGVSELLVDSARPEGATGPDGTFVCAERIGPTPTGTQATLYALTDHGMGWTEVNVVGGVEETGGVEVVVQEPAVLTVAVQDDGGAPLGLVDVTCTPCFGPLAPSRRGERDHHLLYTTNPRMKDLFVRKTDEKGVATFDRLPTGATLRDRYSDPVAFNRYDVVASAKGYDIGFADDVALSAGASMNRAIVLHRIHTVTLVGKVVGLDGDPIPDARVEAWAAPSALVASTDEHGEYRIDKVPSTTRTAFFRVTADRRALHQELYRFEQLKKAALNDDSGAPLEAYTVDIVLERTVHIAGRVVDENGVPIAGATTWFNRVTNGVVDGITFQAEPPQTDAQGHFDYEATESEWQVTAAAPLDDGTAKPPAVPIDNGSTGPPTVRRVTGGATDLVLSCRAHVSSGAKLFCEVIDAETLAPEPVLSAYLWTVDELRLLSRPSKCSLGQITTGGLDVGRWRLELELGDHRHAAKEFEVTNDHDEVRLRVEVGAMAKVAGRIEFDPRLEVQRDPSRAERPIYAWWRPLEAYAVDAVGQVVGDPRNACTKPDASGRFFLDGFVPGKTAIVYATDFDDVYDEVVFTPTPGESRDIVLTLRPAGHWIIQRVDDFSPGNLVVDLAMNDEPWHREDWMDRTPRDAKDFPHAIKPGHHRWRALYLPPSVDVAVARVRSAEGEFDVAAGETCVLRISGLR